MSSLAPAYGLEAAAPLTARTEEDDWVEAARAGDLDAFESIMLFYESRLIRFITGLVGDIEVARELCQDTFLSAYSALPKVKGEMRLSAWLHTIALNKARSHHRKKRFRTLLPFEDGSHGTSIEDSQESVATSELVRRVLDRLPRQYAYPLLLQTTGGLSCKEIADILGCSEGAVKVRLLRAREAFRRIYAEEERGPCPR